MNSLQLTDLAGEIRRQGLWCDWRHGPRLGAMLVSGADSGAFLQAQLTSDVLALQPGGGQLSARLDRRGRLQAWFSLHRLPDRGQPFPVYLCLLPAGEIPALVADLTAYVFNEQVVIEDFSGELSGWVGQIPLARLGSCELPGGDNGFAPADMAEYAIGSQRLHGSGEAWVIRRALTGDSGWVVLVPGKASDNPVAVAWREWAAAAGVVAGDEIVETEAHEVWNWLSAEAGWPGLGRDLAAGSRVLSQTGLDQHAVSFNKGCYLGQEVVARIRTYGSVPEALRAVIWRDLEPADLQRLPGAGEPFGLAAGGACGTCGKSFWSPVLQKAASLVFLDRDHRTPGTRLELARGDESIAGDVALLPLYQGTDAVTRAAQLVDQALREFGAGQDEAAVANLEESLRLDAANAEAYEALGVILGRQQKYHEAIDIFRRLEDVAPAEPMVHTNLSLFYMKIGDKDEAERQKALGTMKRFGVGTSPEEAANLAAREKAERQAAAGQKRAMFAEVLAIDPDDPLALMGMGRALTELDDLEGAAAHLARALEQQQQNSSVYASYGKVLASLDRVAEAAEVYRRGIEIASRRGDLMPLQEMEHRLRLLDR